MAIWKSGDVETWGLAAGLAIWGLEVWRLAEGLAT